MEGMAAWAPAAVVDGIRQKLQKSRDKLAMIADSIRAMG